ncbi:MAG: copper chaperone PCu(A)C [Dongiaceae bacterium]
MFPLTRRSTLLVGLSLALCSGLVPPSSEIATAHEITAGALVIRHPWARATAGAAKVGALYLTVRNQGAEADRLLGVTTDIAEKCELHLSETSGDVMTMRAVEEVEVPPGGSAAFAPRGAHIMLIGLKRPLRKGEHFAATLHFAEAGDVAVEVAVQGIADLEPSD